MKILIVGSGGREHAISWAFSKNKQIEKIFCANGNAGIGEIAEIVEINPTNVQSLVEFAQAEKIDLTFIGGEISLALGIVDEFEKHNLKIIGASKKAAKLESSKAFAKDFMAYHQIPTAKYRGAENIEQAKELLDEFDESVVIKADGLAAGKGVVVAENRAEALKAIDELETTVGSEAMSQIVLE